MRSGRVVAAAAVVVAVRVVSFSLVLPGFRQWAEGLAGATALLAGVALGAYGLTMAVFQFPFGALSDRAGRRLALLLALALAVAGSLWAARAHDVWALLAARLVQGAGATASVGFALVADAVPEDRRTRALAVVGIGAGASFILGLVVGPLLEPAIGMRGLFDASAALNAGAAVPVLWWVPGVAPSGGGHTVRRALSALREPRLLPAMAGGFLINAGMIALMFVLRPRTEDHVGADAAGYWIVGMVIAGALGMGVLSRVADRGRLVGVNAAMLALLGAAPVLVFVDLTMAALVLGGALFFVAHATLSAGLPSLVSRLAPAQHRGAVMGPYNAAQNVGSFAGGAVAGVFASRPGATAALLAGAGLLAAGAMARVGLASDPRGDPAET